MPNLTLPPIISTQDTAQVFRSPRPPSIQVASRLQHLAQLLDLPLVGDDVGYGLMTRRGDIVAEAYHESHSARWGDYGLAGADPPSPVNLPPPAACAGLAEDALRDAGLYDDSAKPIGITHTELAEHAPATPMPPARPIQAHVNYGYELAGLPVFGAGAKAKVTIGDNGRILAALRFWREPLPSGTPPRRVFMPDDALAELGTDRMFTGLADPASLITVTRCQLGYLMLPPRLPQALVLPVYLWEGTVASATLPNYAFRRYVVAVELTPAEKDILSASGQEFPVAG